MVTKANALKEFWYGSRQLAQRDTASPRLGSLDGRHRGAGHREVVCQRRPQAADDAWPPPPASASPLSSLVAFTVAGRWLTTAGRVRERNNRRGGSG